MSLNPSPNALIALVPSSNTITEKEMLALESNFLLFMLLCRILAWFTWRIHVLIIQENFSDE